MATPPQDTVSSAPIVCPDQSQTVIPTPLLGNRPSEALWRKALDHVHREDRAMIDVESLDRDKRLVLENLIGVVQEKQNLCIEKQWSIARHGKSIPLRDLFGKTMACIRDFIAVGDTLVQYDPTHAAIPWAAVRLVLQAATNDSETMQGMAVAVEYMVRLITRYAFVESQYLDHSSAANEQLRGALIRVYTAILVFISRARRYYTKNTAGRAIASVIRPAGLQTNLEEIKTLEEEVEKLTWSMSMEYQRRTASLWQHNVAEMNSTLTSHTETLKNVAKQVESLQTKSNAPVTVDRILTWLDAVYTADEYENARSARLEGTCEWISDRPVFQSWKAIDNDTDVSRILWVFGAPGFGKTMLCASIIQSLDREAGGPVLYFFCDFGDDAKRQPQAILRSWTAQLARYSSEIDPLAVQPFRERVADRATQLELWSLFRKLSLANRNCYFVVDGFDECLPYSPNTKKHSLIDDRSRFLRHLVGSLAGTSSHVLLVSRENSQIRDELTQCCEKCNTHNNSTDLQEVTAPRPVRIQLSHYQVEKSDTGKDIRSFASNIVTENLHNKSSSLQKDIANAASVKCDGMFLWVKLLHDSLSPWKTAKQLEKVVSETPAGLEQAYERDLNAISELSVDDRKRAFTILQWMLFGRKVFTVRELAEALSIDTEDVSGSFPANGLPEAWNNHYVDDFILKPCGSLLELRGKAVDSSLAKMKVHFVHFSAEEFLLKKDSIGLRSPEFVHMLDPVYADEIIARKCIIYLCYDQFYRTRHSTLSEIKKICRKYLFLQYASHEWFNHLKSEGEYSKELLSTLNYFLDPASTRWILSSDYNAHVNHLSRGSNKKLDLLTSPLHIASWCGLVETVKHILDKDVGVNLVCGESGRPLDSAVLFGNLETVKVLLSRGASCRPGPGGLTPLHYLALSTGVFDTSEMVQILLKAGTNLNAKDETSEATPLCYAVKVGRKDIVKLLLEAGADVDAGSGGRGLTPLSIAVYPGQLLLEAGADVDAGSRGRGLALLSTAVSFGHKEIVKLLLEAGADIDDKSGDRGMTPLSTAVYYGQRESLHILLTSGANPNAVDDDGISALMLAARMNHTEFLYLLCKSGADLEAVDQNGRAALTWAIMNDHIECLKALTRLGAAVNVVRGGVMTDSIFAAIRGSKKPLEALLESGVEPNEARSDGLTALMTAAMEGHTESLKALLESGADIDAVDKEGKTALMFAAFQNHTKTVEALLGSGADVDAVDKEGNTALMFAALQNHTKSVEVLLASGADLDATSNEGEGLTALMIAASMGHTQIVGALLRSGADVTARNQYGEIALDLAVSKGHDAAAQELRASGANITLRTGSPPRPTTS